MIRALVKDTRGAVLALMAICLPVALGFTALGLAYPMAAAERGRLQGCIDSAAVAGAAVFLNPGFASQATTYATNFAAINGCGGSTITLDNGDLSVTVDASSSASAFWLFIPISVHSKVTHEAIVE